MLIEFLMMELTQTIEDPNRNPHLNIRLVVGICHSDDIVSRTRFRIFTEYVLSDEIQDVCSIYLEFHRRTPLRGIYRFGNIDVLC